MVGIIFQRMVNQLSFQNKVMPKLAIVKSSAKRTLLKFAVFMDAKPDIVSPLMFFSMNRTDTIRVP